MVISAMIFLPFLIAAAGYLIGRKKENAYYWIILGAAALEFLLALGHAFSGLAARRQYFLPVLVDQGLLLETDGFRNIYAVIISLMWLATLMLTRDYFRGHHKLARYYFFNLMTLGATMGVFFSGNLYTALVFFEIMSFTSFPWVIQEETDGAIRAANTYLAVAVIGGLAALFGIFMISYKLGTTEIASLYDAARACPDKGALYLSGACILFGFGAKAGMFPLHIWLPKAHPVAPAPASALLSGVLTKSGIFGVLAVSANLFRHDPAWGAVILGLGTITMLLGAVLALLSIDLKRTLACSSMSQIGFILIGIGMMGLLGEENALAARGALLHMVNHSLFKLVLFMCAGVVYMNLHKLDLNEIRGFGRGKLFLNICFLLGAAGIAGIPGLNGYISKTLLHESIVEGVPHYGPILKVVEWIFLVSGGLTLAYMTKLYVCLFVEKAEKPGKGHRTEAGHGTASEVSEHGAGSGVTGHGAASFGGSYMSPLSKAALGASALLLPALGFTAGRSMNALADIGTDFFHAGELEESIHYYSFGNLKGGLISIAIGALVYLFIVRKFLIRNGRYVNLLPSWLDLEDRVYRPLLLRILPDFFGAVSRIFAENRVTVFLAKGVMAGASFVSRVFAENRVTAAVSKGILAAAAWVSGVFAENRVTAAVSKTVLSSASWVSGVFSDNRITAALAKGILRASDLINHAACDLVDALILLLRKTLFRESPVPVTDRVMGTLPYRLGNRVDRLSEKKGKRTASPHRYARLYYRFTETLRHAVHNLSDTLSFALFAMCFAIAAILIYILVIHG